MFREVLPHLYAWCFTQMCVNCSRYELSVSGENYNFRFDIWNMESLSLVSYTDDNITLVSQVIMYPLFSAYMLYSFVCQMT